MGRRYREGYPRVNNLLRFRIYCLLVSVVFVFFDEFPEFV
jgi:hypothetical protein